MFFVSLRSIIRTVFVIVSLLFVVVILGVSLHIHWLWVTGYLGLQLVYVFLKFGIYRIPHKYTFEGVRLYYFSGEHRSGIELAFRYYRGRYCLVRSASQDVWFSWEYAECFGEVLPPQNIIYDVNAATGQYQIEIAVDLFSKPVRQYLLESIPPVLLHPDVDAPQHLDQRLFDLWNTIIGNIVMTINNTSRYSIHNQKVLFTNIFKLKKQGRSKKVVIPVQFKLLQVRSSIFDELEKVS